MAPSPRNPAELLGGVLEQRLDRIGTAAIERAEIPPRRTRLVQPNIFSAEDVDRVFGTDGALAARLHLQRSRRFAGICAAPERDNETFQHRGRYEGGKNGTFFRLRDKRLVSSLTSHAGREDVPVLIHEQTCPHHVRLCSPSI